MQWKDLQRSPVPDPDHAIRDLTLSYLVSLAATAGMISGAIGVGWIASKVKERRDRKDTVQEIPEQ